MKLVKDFYACLPGQYYPQTFAAGTDCPSELLDIAKSLNLVESEKPKDAKSVKPAKPAKATK